MHPSASHNSQADWFTEAKLGLFIHYGLYALPAGVWRGRAMAGIGETIMQQERIPLAEYRSLANLFNPTEFDAGAWVIAAQDAGMRYLVFTAKHHDGFAMYRSASDPYNIVDATLFRRDILEELAEACRRAHMRLCVYYSHCLDWSRPHAGNDWDFPHPTAVGFENYLQEKVQLQLTELLTQYGEIGFVWFDAPTSDLTQSQAQRLKVLVKKLQPDCLVNDRIGHGLRDFITLGDHEIPSRRCDTPTEVFTTLNDTWGYKIHDHNWKSVERIRSMRASANAYGFNLLLNVGPQPDGAFPIPAIQHLNNLGHKS